MKKLQRICVLICIQLFLVTSVRADEGMWLPLYINKVINNMKSEGCKLKAEQIYNVNTSSVKDGVVHFGGFCTGEIVSNRGLIFTNHHCGYDIIAKLSTPEHNYLDNGYWATHDSLELPVPGFTASILVRMEDVTARVTGAANKDEEIKKIIAEATNGNHYTAKVESMFFGTEYYLMVHEVFRDIRFVGTPPQSLGKFGGDTDNWMWPRHTADFSVFRIYVGPDNKPAEYSKNNKPYTPRYFFPINIKGIKPNDFVMIMGYPGRTTRYLTEASTESLVHTDYPERASVLKAKLDMWGEEMDKDINVRLHLSGTYASLMNAQKYYEGAINALKSSPCLTKKKLLEKGFTDWVNADANRKTKYGTILADIAKLEADSKEMIRFTQYLNYGYYGIQLAIFGRNFKDLKTKLEDPTHSEDDIKTEVMKIRNLVPGFYHGYEKARMADEKALAAVLRLAAKQLDKKFWPASLTRADISQFNAPKGDIFDAYAHQVFSTSMLADSNKLNTFLKNPARDALNNDWGITYSMDILTLRDTYRPQITEIATKRMEYMKTYIQGLKEYQAGKFMYPDANSTMRLTYGQVKSYAPRDGMSYNWYTTQKGILQKEIPGNDEFTVPAELKDLLVKGDFGRYGNKNGELPVCFLANLDITGGNSGSPVINGKGELVGIAFDGVWEGMVGDIYFDDNNNRTISVDIRYVLFIIDKMSHADRIMNELKIIQ